MILTTKPTAMAAKEKRSGCCHSVQPECLSGDFSLQMTFSAGGLDAFSLDSSESGPDLRAVAIVFWPAAPFPGPFSMLISDKIGKRS